MNIPLYVLVSGINRVLTKYDPSRANEGSPPQPSGAYQKFVSASAGD